MMENNSILCMWFSEGATRIIELLVYAMRKLLYFLLDPGPSYIFRRQLEKPLLFSCVYL